MLRYLGDLRLGTQASGPWANERLGLLEHWYAAQAVPRIAGFMLELPHRVDQEVLVRALEALCSRHPYSLAVTLRTGRGGAPMFEPCTAALPLTSAAAGDPWTVAAQALHAPFPVGGPLWRVTVADAHLVATFHHAIADGISVSIFARELLALLRGAALLGFPEPRRPLDVRLDLRPSLRQLAREVGAVLHEPGYYCGPEHDAGSRRTQLFPCTLPASLVATVAARARREGATVHTALCTAGLVATALHVRTAAQAATRASFPLRARLLTPISLRAHCTPEPTGMGVFLCGLASDHQLLGEQRFWRFAEDYAGRVRAALPECYQRLGLLRFAGSLERRAEKLSRRLNARTATLEVSNLGRVEGLADARLWFIQGNHYHGPLFNVSVATCAESGVLRATLAIPVPVVEPQQATDVLRVFARVIADSVEGDLTLQEASDRASKAPSILAG